MSVSLVSVLGSAPMGGVAASTVLAVSVPTRRYSFTSSATPPWDGFHHYRAGLNSVSHINRHLFVSCCCLLPSLRGSTVIVVVSPPPVIHAQMFPQILPPSYLLWLVYRRRCCHCGSELLCCVVSSSFGRRSSEKKTYYMSSRFSLSVRASLSLPPYMRVSFGSKIGFSFAIALFWPSSGASRRRLSVDSRSALTFFSVVVAVVVVVVSPMGFLLLRDSVALDGDLCMCCWIIL